jgi:hypothetical protein
MVKFLEVEKCLSQEEDAFTKNALTTSQYFLARPIIVSSDAVNLSRAPPDFITGTPKIYRSNKCIKFFCSALRIKVFVIRSFVVGVVRVRL